MPNPTPKERLNKLMAQQGLCSRREADDFIARGWVFVDGIQINELGTKIDPRQTITLAQEAQRQTEQSITILLNKPLGYVSNLPEAGYKDALDLITKQNYAGQHKIDKMPSLKKLSVAGRLDINSTGLLIFTQDGRIAKQLIGQNSQVDKEYLVRFTGEITAEKLKRLRHGLKLDGKPLKPAKIEQINTDQLKFCLKEGRKRQIRRMCELVELNILALKRVRVGRVRLGKLPLGKWRFLNPNERFL